MSDSNGADSFGLSDLYSNPEDVTHKSYLDDWSPPSLTDRLNSDPNTIDSPPGENMESLFSDETGLNPTSSDIEWGTIGNALLSDPDLPFSGWKNNDLEFGEDWTRENISPDLINDPLQWAQDHPFAAAGAAAVIGTAGYFGAEAYYNNVGNLGGSFDFNVGDWQFDVDLGLRQNEVDGSDDFHFQINVTYPF